MRVLILNWRDPKNPKAGGAEKVTYHHARGLINRGHQVTWISSGFNKSRKDEVIDGIKHKRLGGTYTVNFFAFFYLLFNNSKYDFVIDEIHGYGFFTPLCYRGPRIAYIHEIAGEIWNVMFPFPLNVLGKMMEYFMFVIYKNEKFLTGAESAKKDLVKKGIKSSNIYIIHHGVDQEKLRSIPKEKNPTFIFVNRLVKMKGIEDVLKAHQIICKKMPAAKLWIVGKAEDEYMQHLKNLIKELNIEKNVTFFGFVNVQRKADLLRRAHILLHASIKEGWGLVIIEAALQKTTSIVYNVPGLVDSVINGKTGIVIKKNNPAALANQTFLLLENKEKYKALCENAYKRAKFFTWDKSTRESVALFEKLGK